MVGVVKTSDSEIAVSESRGPNIYFDHATLVGHTNGIADVCLLVQRVVPGTNGQAGRVVEVVANLRCRLDALKEMRAAIDHLIAAMRAPEGGVN